MRLRAYRGQDRQFVADGVEHDHDRRSHEDAVRQAENVGVRLAQLFHVPDHVVAEIAEDAGGHGGKVLPERDCALGQQQAKGVERGLGAQVEGIGALQRNPVDLGDGTPAAEDEIGGQADHRIAAPDGAAFDRLEQESGAAGALAQLEERRDRRLEVADQARPDDLGLPCFINARKRFESHYSAG